MDKLQSFSEDKEIFSAIKTFNSFLKKKNIKIGSIGSIIEHFKSVKNAKAKKSIKVNKKSVCRQTSASISTKSLIFRRYTKSISNFLKARSGVGNRWPECKIIQFFLNFVSLAAAFVTRYAWATLAILLRLSNPHYLACFLAARKIFGLPIPELEVCEKLPGSTNWQM